jgi:hypothetical protein
MLTLLNILCTAVRFFRLAPNMTALSRIKKDCSTSKSIMLNRSQFQKFSRNSVNLKSFFSYFIAFKDSFISTLCHGLLMKSHRLWGNLIKEWYHEIGERHKYYKISKHSIALAKPSFTFPITPILCFLSLFPLTSNVLRQSSESHIGKYQISHLLNFFQLG